MAGKTKRYELYIDGNTVRKLEAAPVRVPKAPVRPPQKRPEKKQQTSSKAFMVLFVAAVSLTFMICIGYLSCQATNNSLASEINSLEKEIDRISSVNDSIEYEIYGSIDMEQVISTAVNELGMIKLTKNNIEYYESTKDEYVTQYGNIPD
jgi:cell division protein FtsL